MSEPGLVQMSLVEAAGALARGEVGSLVLVEAFLERIAERNGSTNAFIHVAADQARYCARQSDKRRRNGKPRSTIDGVPVALKDNICVVGQPMTNGFNHAWEPNAGADIAGLMAARGAVFIGKTNMDEGAIGTTTDNPHHGRTDNPAVPGSNPGGSSGGSAAAVADYMCPIAIGTDTMGSVRIPAAHCGIVGFKPSRDFWPTTGVIPVAAGLDTVGPLARSVADIALIMDLPLERPDPKRLRFGILENFERCPFDKGVEEAFREACGRIKRGGIAIQEVAVTDYEPSKARRNGFLVCEVESGVRNDDWRDHPWTRHHHSPAYREMIDYGAAVLASRYVAARQEIARLEADLARALRPVDAILTPTAPQTAAPFGAPTPKNQADCTAMANFGGCPAISLPAGKTASGYPVGIQLIGPRDGDAALLGIAAVVEDLLKNQDKESSCP